MDNLSLKVNIMEGAHLNKKDIFVTNVSNSVAERIKSFLESEGIDSQSSCRIEDSQQNEEEIAREYALAENPAFVVHPIEGSEKCRHCLSMPCVTNERFQQGWWPRHHEEPHGRNSSLRKVAYKKFWTMLLHRDLWRNPEYLVRKVQALAVDERRRQLVWSGYNKRDIMPDCVITIVRHWYPNIRDQQYLGHKWD